MPAGLLFRARAARAGTLGVRARAAHARTLMTDGPIDRSLAHVRGSRVHPRLLTGTIGSAFDAVVADHSVERALVSVHQGVWWTYGELKYNAELLASGLARMGYTRGDRLGVWLPNTHEYVLCQLACAKLGVVLVTVNPAYRAPELEHALNLVGCKGLVLKPRIKTSDYASILSTLIPNLDSLRATHLAAARVPSLRHVFVTGSETVAGTIAFDSVLAGSVDPALAASGARLSPSDVLNVQFTSGTTGLPKGAALTHSNILNNGYMTGQRMGLRAGDAVCIPVPLYHCLGLVLGNLAAMTNASTMVYPSEIFDAAAVLSALKKERCTAVLGVPTMFHALVAHPSFVRRGYPSLRTGIMAGSACPADLMARVIEEMGASELTICYGMTETSPVSFQTQPTDNRALRCETVGTIHPHVECKIVDRATGATVRRGEVGELYTRGYGVMRGYWNMPEQTAESIVDGWMRTGDLASIDDTEAGHCRIVGRSKDMIIRGGENIFPREIETVLARHGRVRDVAVVGVPDEKYGEQVCAWVHMDGVEGDEPHVLAAAREDVSRFCKEQMAHYKVPRYIVINEPFPMTVTGKVQKFKMRDRSVELLQGKHRHDHSTSHPHTAHGHTHHTHHMHTHETKR
eukprot:Opistho-2@51328